MKAIEKGAVISGAGALFLGASLALSSATVVSSATRAHRGANPAPAKSETCNAKSSCFTVSNTGAGSAINGSAGSGYGVWGSSDDNIGVYGASNSDGVEGDAQTSGNGVYGLSSSGNGVYGDAQGSGAGVYGLSSSGYGVYGQSTSSFGVYGQSADDIGVIGESNFGNGGYFQNDTTSAAALYAENLATDAPLLQVVNSPSGDEFYVDGAADGFFSGSVTASGYETFQPARGGSHLEAFDSESTRATIEDTGTARLEAGEGTVRFDSAFASTIDAARGYQVFLTPNGDTRGLYVAAKYEGGFIVRENERGRSSVYFDYRVVAHPYGATDARLPQLTIKLPPRAHLRIHPQPRQP
ncbi:MAG TPA: hypothetical protein VFF63_09335 [Candidatus Babeliales bacterium]|nr:hypothetical protein [Candidatus Babeliales bacterium]